MNSEAGAARPSPPISSYRAPFPMNVSHPAGGHIPAPSSSRPLFSGSSFAPFLSSSPFQTNAAVVEADHQVPAAATAAALAVPAPDNTTTATDSSSFSPSSSSSSSPVSSHSPHRHSHCRSRGRNELHHPSANPSSSSPQQQQQQQSISNPSLQLHSRHDLDPATRSTGSGDTRRIIRRRIFTAHNEGGGGGGDGDDCASLSPCLGAADPVVADIAALAAAAATVALPLPLPSAYRRLAALCADADECLRSIHRDRKTSTAYLHSPYHPALLMDESKVTGSRRRNHGDTSPHPHRQESSTSLYASSFAPSSERCGSGVGSNFARDAAAVLLADLQAARRCYQYENPSLFPLASSSSPLKAPPTLHIYCSRAATEPSPSSSPSSSPSLSSRFSSLSPPARRTQPAAASPTNKETEEEREAATTTATHAKATKYGGGAGHEHGAAARRQRHDDRDGVYEGGGPSGRHVAALGALAVEAEALATRRQSLTAAIQIFRDFHHHHHHGERNERHQRHEVSPHEGEDWMLIPAE